jgi:endonuclease G, mitochondrial
MTFYRHCHTILFALAWVASTLSAALPISHFHFQRVGYVVQYSGQHKNPAWTYEHLTEKGLEGTTNRSRFPFMEDLCIPSHLRAVLADYRRSGYDRGHMVPAGDCKGSFEAMGASFLLSNVCPQCHQMNCGAWAKLEQYARDLTRQHESVTVISGPLYLPNIEENGRRFVKYEVIGPNDVAVPTHFFKVIVLGGAPDKKEVLAFILPNENIPLTLSFQDFKSTFERVEKAAGLILFPKYPSQI